MDTGKLGGWFQTPYANIDGSCKEEQPAARCDNQEAKEGNQGGEENLRNN